MADNCFPLEYVRDNSCSTSKCICFPRSEPDSDMGHCTKLVLGLSRRVSSQKGGVRTFVLSTRM